MKLRDLYAKSDLTLSFEFFPPKTPEGDAALFREVEILKTLNPGFCSVTYGAGGSTRDKTVEIVMQLHDEFGLEVMCHLTVVGQSKDDVRGVLNKLKANRIENIIALAGDPPKGVTDWTPHPSGFHYSTELVQEAASYDWFSIAVAGFPEVHPRAESRESDLRYLKLKVDAGADVVITQLFFDNEDYYRYVDDCRKIGITVPIVPGLLPVQSTMQTRRFAAMCGSKIPSRLDELLTKVENDPSAEIDLGIEYATEQCLGLLRFGVPGIHFYSLNKSRSVKAVLENLSLKSRAGR
ncbi:MAG TPA: methylenetetrahydrofolate reductase [NAD(P)H] [Terriglobia bacterium]|nr:methylenetetrahydrofolate reductase [NAD(P)H] [Terriglobia bacterium]